MMTNQPDESPPVALSIAGSDSGGGAGIQADIKAMAKVGVHACTAITSLTAQNSTGVQGINPVPPDFVSKQISSVVDDFPVDATKTGMLYGPEIMKTVIDHREALGQLVVDPVMVSATGDSLMEPEGEQILIEELLPVADLITPNLSETQKILDRTNESIKNVSDEESIIRALNIITEYLDGPAVLIKGGHVEGGESTDRLMDRDGSVQSFSSERLSGDNTHGSGCVLSSLIAGFLAHGNELPEAVSKSKRVVTDTMNRGYSCGRGMGTLNLLQS